MRRARWQSDESFDIPQTPLIDIIFNLIIFFLVATTFYTEERDLKIELPEGTEGELIAKESNHFVINVRAAGVIVVNNKLLNMEQLESELRRVARDQQHKVEVRADADTRHGRVMEVMNLCKKCGIDTYALTQRIVHQVD